MTYGQLHPILLSTLWNQREPTGLEGISRGRLRVCVPSADMYVYYCRTYEKAASVSGERERGKGEDMC